MSDIIWALDQRDRCIACPSTPLTNAVVLHVSRDGALARASVGAWAERGVMAAGVQWPGRDATLSDDDWLDLEDAVGGLAGLAQVVAVFGDPGTETVVAQLASRTDAISLNGGTQEQLLATLRELAPA